MISYKPLFKLLIDKEMSLSQLKCLIGCSPRTSAKFSKNEYVSLELLERICKQLNCKLDDIVQIY